MVYFIPCQDKWTENAVTSGAMPRRAMAFQKKTRRLYFHAMTIHRAFLTLCQSGDPDSWLQPNVHGASLAAILNLHHRDSGHWSVPFQGLLAEVLNGVVRESGIVHRDPSTSWGRWKVCVVSKIPPPEKKDFQIHGISYLLLIIKKIIFIKINFILNYLLILM